ncbi:hypothetical protein [Thaumasiovibrio subtropicus]|uniref:hypothetical protein n=1 Tax=Thaumasiovibrio subtropicus TaxID=1891207 RepID=UPI00131B3C01|nr:hypothetical protein [Thaumasiovibrio subtropicus]
MNRIRNGLHGLAFTYLLLMWGYIFFRLVTQNENYFAGNVVMYSLPLLVWAMLDTMLALSFRLPVKTRSIITALFSVVLTGMLYHFNILLPYEDWIAKGMPPRPF